MKANVIVDQDAQKVKRILDCQTGKIGWHWAADAAENVTRLIEQEW
jgi:hypothetical protein